ncbi:glycoside hydrolase superfamily [Aspergillus pseudodeflectus]|uniref:glucan 1,3-beta-glucosidase n=1 Tax=Aspergillus pseudodeflectus TaxID=176178 RepID=A0ABR4L773_9EURO
MTRLIFATLLSYFGTTVAAAEYINWTTYKANGVNLGGWIVQELFIDSAWWAAHSKCAIAPDEWTLCANLGRSCGPVLDQRYASWITTQDIDRLHAARVNTLRIPTTYAAWVEVPGSKLYSGKQVEYLRTEGHYGWLHNQTPLDYTLDAVDAVLEYIQQSGHPESYTIEPINEPVDNGDISTFCSPLSLSHAGTTWVLNYINAVLARVSTVNPKIPVMFQGGFLGPEYWSSNLDPSANLVFNVHNYYFTGRNAAGHNLTSYICSDAQTSGSAYWTAKCFGEANVDGEGVQAGYWDYLAVFEQGMLNPDEAANVCAQ